MNRDNALDWNAIAKEIIGEELFHYGMPRRSGRYPWGSGDNPYQHSLDFVARCDKMKSEGMSEKEIAQALGLKTTEFRAQYSYAIHERRAYLVNQAKSMREDGYTLDQIAEKMGFANDSSVRSLLNERTSVRQAQTKKTVEFLRQQVEEKGMIDVGKGVEAELGITKERLNEALYILEMEGYNVYGGRIDQVTQKDNKTTIKVLATSDYKNKDVYNPENIKSITDYHAELDPEADDGSEKFYKLEYPASMDSSRIQMNWTSNDHESGGVLKDGIVELRPGVKDLSLGNSLYSQVRILVDDNYYIKGMAVYGDPKDFEDGKDIIINSNKTADKGLYGHLKEIKHDDPNNPFNSLLKSAENGGQYHYLDDDGNEKLGLINKTREEGDWDWSNTLPSQFLGKQSTKLITQQLNLTLLDKKQEYAEIMSLTNPTVKRVLLNKFADECDSDAVDLKAAALPGQKYAVILASTTLKDNEVFAPNYKDGTQLALVRYPHGGTFEIPIVTVNNKNEECLKVLGKNPADAIMINKTNADRLSGADFDGDTVMCIPTNTDKVKITSTKPLAGLVGFDTKLTYGASRVETDADGNKHYFYGDTEYQPMKKGSVQQQMGRISNLITDMTLKGASEEELAAATRHSMVVIDAEKHKLNYKQSEIDNNIQALKEKYQAQVDPETGEVHYGSSTLLSRAGAEEHVLKRQGSPRINTPETAKDLYDPDRPEGSLVYKTSDNAYWEKTDKKTGEKKLVARTQNSTRMAETDDAYTLLSGPNHEGTTKEKLYADYANNLKQMARDARLEVAKHETLEYSPEAKKEYFAEYQSLTHKLALAEANKPKERAAQILANTRVKAITTENPNLSKDSLKKLKQKELTEARAHVGAKRTTVDITPKEWEAIQKGAISDSKLVRILGATDTDVIRNYAMPKESKTVSQARINKIKAMEASGYTNAEIAEATGVSVSTVSKYLKE